MRAVIVAVTLMLASWPGHARGEAAVAYGIIAPGRAYYGYVNNSPTRAAARAAALSACRQRASHCEISNEFNNACFAVVRNSVSFFFGSGPSIAAAQHQAFAYCRGIPRGFRSPCRVDTSFCDHVSEQALATQRQEQERQRQVQERQRQEQELQRQVQERQQAEERRKAEERERAAEAERARQRRELEELQTARTAALQAQQRARLQLFLASLPLALVPLVSLLLSLWLAGRPVFRIACELFKTVPTRARRLVSLATRFVRAFRIAYAERGLHGSPEAHPAAASSTASAISHPSPPPLPVIVPPIPEPRNSQEAQIAIELAFSYMREFQDDIFDHIADPVFMQRVQETLALISRQIKIAEKADPTAAITVENADGSPLVIDIDFLKSHALLYEGISYAPSDLKRGVKILRQAEAIAPASAPLQYWIGQCEAAQLNRRAAIAALEKAVALDPTDIGMRKALDRVRNISGASIAVDRAFSAGRTTVRVGRWLTLILWLLPFVLIAGGLLTANYPAAIAGFVFMMIGGAALKGMDRAKDWFRQNLG